MRTGIFCVGWAATQVVVNAVQNDVADAMGWAALVVGGIVMLILDARRRKEALREIRAALSGINEAVEDSKALRREARTELLEIRKAVRGARL